MATVGSPSEMVQLAFGKLPQAALLTRGREHIVTSATELFGKYFGDGDRVGQSLLAGYPDLASAQCAAAMDLALGSGVRAQLDHISIGAGDAKADYSFVVEPIPSADGEVVGVLVVAERHREPRSPTSSLQAHVLASTFAAMREGVTVFDEAGTIVFANRAAESMFGEPSGTLVGRPVADLTAAPAWQSAHLLEAMNASVRDSGSWSGDRYNRRANGERFVTAAHITSFDFEGRSYRLCIEEDVTEQRRDDDRTAFLANAASILGQSLDYRDTLAAVTQLCIPAIADLTVIDVLNEHGSMERVGCAHRDAALLPVLRKTTLPNGRAKSALKSTMRSGSAGGTVESPSRENGRGTTAPIFLRDVTDTSLRALGWDGDTAVAWHQLGVKSWMSLPIALHGEEFGVLALGITEDGRRFNDSDLEVAIDLSTRIANAIDNARLHTATTAARDEAERANRAKSDLLAHASHDLRTPLNAISGYAELLEMGILGPVNDAQRDALARVQRSQRHLLALINDLLHFTKLESGSVEFEFAEIDVSTVTKEVTSLLREQAATKGIELKYEAAPGVRAWADEEKVFQIVLNLVRNAVKFTADKGTVTVRVSQAQGDESAQVIVADNGIGIPGDKVDAIFEPFTQVGRSFSRPLEGSGLGLAISRELTRAMGGVLSVSSVVGEGSIFTLTLPRRRSFNRRGA